MGILRNYRLLLGLAQLAWIGASAISKPTPAGSRFRRDVTASDTGGDWYCPAVNGISWTLFGEKCYYRYYAPLGFEGTSREDIKKHYKTWFEARDECAKLGADLASVHDNATHEKLLQLVAGNETLTRLEETTWIGLQVGTLHEVEFEDNWGDVRYENETGCYWPADVRPRLEEDDPCPENAVEECSVTYNDTFLGQWEDGELYNETESADFWSPDEPNERDSDFCNGIIFPADAQSKISISFLLLACRIGTATILLLSNAYCERGVDGEPDQQQHCALILPQDEKQMRIPGEDRKLSPGKWVDYWCWMKVRGYICERPAKRLDASEDSTTPTVNPSGVETQLSTTTMFCGVDTTTWPEICTGRARARIDEIVLEINATRTSYSVVIETMALGGAAAGTTWLGGSASFADLARSAIDFGRNITRLSFEECIPESRDLPLQLQELTKKVDGSYDKIDEGLNANRNIRITLMTTYDYARKTLIQGNEAGTGHYSGSLTTYCKTKFLPEQELITKMTSYFSSAPEDMPLRDFDVDLVSAVACGPDSKRKLQLLMAEADTLARLALTLLGVCAESENVPRSELNEWSKKAIQAFSKVNGAFIRALQNDAPPCSNSTPTPFVGDIVADMTSVAKHVLNETKKGQLNSKGWSGREELHQEIVNGTVDALRRYSSVFAFNALAFLPEKRIRRQCHKFHEDRVVDAGYRNLNFFVFYANSSSNETAEKAWRELNDNKDARDAVLDHVFSKGNADLCGRLTTALKDNDVNMTSFGGVAAVKCGYEFVWYELGYTYFYAAYSSTEYQWQIKSGAYDAECGQIFFFP